MSETTGKLAAIYGMLYILELLKDLDEAVWPPEHVSGKADNIIAYFNDFIVTQATTNRRWELATEIAQEIDNLNPQETDLLERIEMRRLLVKFQPSSPYAGNSEE